MVQRRDMDLLQKSAVAFQGLLAYEYHFIIGRKGQTREFYLRFEKTDFHHLLGLHKLKDIAQIQQGMREKIFDKVLNGTISHSLIEKSAYYEQMCGRILPLIDLEKMLDDNEMIFRYNEKIHKFSLIKADYLLEGEINSIPSFLFLGKRADDEIEQMCKTFFRKESMDYTRGQAQYTLLKKEKKHILSGKIVIQYDRLTARNQ